jgi:hypothetical protein
MRITIDEQARLVHAGKGAVTLTLALPRAQSRKDLEAAADGLRTALKDARVVVINGQALPL